MNILPKKRWHVRTKDNIARVRRDEAAALEEEKKRQQKLELAESEARINYLRKQSGLPEKHSASEDIAPGDVNTETVGGVDLFADYKTHIKTTNKELEKEKKEEQEKYEKQIGYLTYLGQDTNEALKLRSWYEVAPKRAEVGDINITEKDLKTKLSHDPLTLITALLPPEKRKDPKQRVIKRHHSPLPPTNVQETPASPQTSDKKKHRKHKKEKKHKKDKKKKHEKLYSHVQDRADREKEKREKLEKLRKERLRREAAEKARQDALFAPKEIEPVKDAVSVASTPRIVQKYNSQFNPEIAKQNML